MCRIRFEIETAARVTTAKGRYRKVGASSWNEFSINLGNPQTPDIKEIGEYEMQIRVNNGKWQGNYPFSVKEDCGNASSGGGTDAGQGQGGKTDPKTDPDQQPHTPQDGNNTHDPDEDLGGGDNGTDDSSSGGTQEIDCEDCIQQAKEKTLGSTKRDGTIRVYLDVNCTLKCPMTSKLGRVERVDLGNTWYDVAIYDVVDRPELIGQEDTVTITVCGEEIAKTFVIPSYN